MSKEKDKMLEMNPRDIPPKRGPAGPPGEIGAPGPAGETGARGLSGVGVREAVNVDGHLIIHFEDGREPFDAGLIVGPEGKPGGRGPIGETGESGEAGEAGQHGPGGADGERGQAGMQGPPGPQGPSGPAGEAPEHELDQKQGRIRFRMPDGSWGKWITIRGAVMQAHAIAGKDGAAGAAGATGATGATGAKGDTGDTGATGATGPAGTQTHNPLKVYRGVADSEKAGALVLGHNVFNMGNDETTDVTVQIHVPTDWDTAIDPTIHVVGWGSGTGSNDDYRFEFGFESGGNGSTIDGVDDDTVTYTQSAPDAANELLYGDIQTIDRAALSLAVNDHMRITFRRLGSAGPDTRSGTFRFLHIMVIFPRDDSGVTT